MHSFCFYVNHGYDVIPVCAAVSLNETAAIFSYKLRSDGRVGDGFPTENRRVRYGVVSVGRSPREAKWDESAADIIFDDKSNRNSQKASGLRAKELTEKN